MTYSKKHEPISLTVVMLDSIYLDLVGYISMGLVVQKVNQYRLEIMYATIYIN